MPGIQEQIGILNNLNNGYEYIQDRTEKQQDGLNTLINNCNNLFNWFKNLFSNWQLLILGAVACLIIWKRI